MNSVWSTSALGALPLQISIAAAVLIAALCAVQGMASARNQSSLTVWCVASICWLLAPPALLGGFEGALSSVPLTLTPAIAAVSTWWVARQLIIRPSTTRAESPIVGGALGLMVGAALFSGLAGGWLEAQSGPSTAAAAAAAAAGLILEGRRLKDRSLQRWLGITVGLLASGSAGIWTLNTIHWPCCEGMAPFVTPAWVLCLTLAVLGLHQTHDRACILKQAAIDGLTGLSRREALFTYFKSLGLRADQSVAVIMVDADHFKQINDQHGHAAGDAVLARLGQVIASNVRDADLAARYGGEEFCVVLAAEEAQTVRGVAERLVREVSRSRIVLNEHLTLQVTVSAGYAIGTAGDLASCFRAADTALYAAKQAGRDRALGVASR